MVTVLSDHVHESGVHVDEAGPVSVLVGAVLNKAPEEGLKVAISADRSAKELLYWPRKIFVLEIGLTILGHLLPESVGLLLVVLGVEL